MKYFAFLIISLFLISNGYAQDSIPRREKLSDSVRAHYFALRSNPEVKVGSYLVYLHRRTLLVAGHYRNNKKIGVWQFFDIKGNLNERYNYDRKQFTYEAPLSSSPDFSYLFDDNLKKGDKVTKPLKIGGNYYGFLPYLNVFKTPFNTFDVNTDAFEAYVELLISPMGRLADFRVLLGSNEYDYKQIFNLDINFFNEEDRTFVPATLNGKPVMSRILIHCYVTGDGGLDYF